MDPVFGPSDASAKNRSLGPDSWIGSETLEREAAELEAGAVIGDIGPPTVIAGPHSAGLH
ncbi:hypothetical protein DYI37_15455 [Fulvimarina endophytica]|uniref:Uncharacterized protein n=1 Tax=Fulvimarina endophytica TaxID=2293836 RepID=A0A371X064_9HYPH|nr:hypothetical protein DYI37_15455 [Fulvimarina endophytica]